LTWFIDTQQYHKLPQFEFPPIPFERIARQVERCIIQVGYLRELAIREIGPEKVAAIKSAIEERNEWMYGHRKAGKSREWIMLELQRHEDWPQLTTPQAVGQAVDRYCDRNDIPRLRATETK
jgi:hypothetical protein